MVSKENKEALDEAAKLVQRAEGLKSEIESTIAELDKSRRQGEQALRQASGVVEVEGYIGRLIGTIRSRLGDARREINQAYSALSVIRKPHPHADLSVTDRYGNDLGATVDWPLAMAGESLEDVYEMLCLHNFSGTIWIPGVYKVLRGRAEDQKLPEDVRKQTAEELTDILSDVAQTYESFRKQQEGLDQATSGLRKCADRASRYGSHIGGFLERVTKEGKL